MDTRCGWAEHSHAERIYHDTEWGIPVRSDEKMFECITLQGAQAGLSWRTVLAKRDRYREAFLQYDIARVASLTDDDMAIRLRDPGLIRHRLKIASVRSNARNALRVIEEHGSFASFLWSFVGGQPVVNARQNDDDVPGRSDVSDRMSDALRAYGFRFAGTAICYATMQASGMVNDHLVECIRYR